MKTFGILETQTLASIILDENGDPILESLIPNPLPEDWKPPTIVNLIKLDKPDCDELSYRLEPNLVWYEDRVERDWIKIPLSTEEISAITRKIWGTVSDFWNEFSNNEKYAIEVSQDPTLIILRADLKLWLKDVWSDDPRIQFAMGKLVELGILSEERKAQILTKTS